MLRLLIFALLTILVISCKNTESPKIIPKEKESVYSLASPRNGETFTNKDSINIKISSVSGIKPDSCILFIDGKQLGKTNNETYNLDPINLKMGVRRFAMHIFTGTDKEVLPFALKIKPNSAPKQYTYKVVKEYPHDVKGYTQGLFFLDGYLYESTGEFGSSSLRKVELNTGKVLNQMDMDKDLFGEGACLFNGKIYQLTWKNKKGFVYNLDFEKESSFTYNTEGWGIESDGERLWMTDGSANLYRMNPDMSIAEQIEVQTDRGSVPYLNELEYINGELWANVYNEDYIVTIKPETGEVTAVIDLSGILDKKLQTYTTDVLNGIAYDKATDRIFVTGKNWARLFEIKIIPKK